MQDCPLPENGKSFMPALNYYIRAPPSRGRREASEIEVRSVGLIDNKESAVFMRYSRYFTDVARYSLVCRAGNKNR
jgi:hypothetical protein